MAARPRHGGSEFVNGLALCAGYGGLELGLHLADPRYRTVCYVEREAVAAATLVARMADASLDPAPVWDDLLSFDGVPWRGKIQIVAGGFPCQPWSVAGKQRGLNDERWLWPKFTDIIRDVEPSIVFLENVPGLISGGGLQPVLGSLADLGFDAEWGVFSAADVGAPHLRKRVFILAHHHHHRCEVERSLRLRYEETSQRDNADGCCGSPVADSECDTLRIQPGRSSWSNRPSRRGPGDDCEELADTTIERIRESDDTEPAINEDRTREDVGRRRGGVHERGVGQADAFGERLEVGSGEPADARTEFASIERIRRELPIFPPPRDPARWVDIPPEAQPSVCGVADGNTSRLDRLRLCGNGVVPLAAAYAYRTLSARFER